MTKIQGGGRSYIEETNPQISQIAELTEKRLYDKCVTKTVKKTHKIDTNKDFT